MKFKTWYFPFILLFFLNSCLLKKADYDKKIYGTWNAIGYGQQIEINERISALYETYESGCHLRMRLPTSFLDEIYTVTQLTNDHLQLTGGFTEYNFKRVPESELCGTSKNKNNPLVNFDALWETFNENYAFFNLRNVNWNELKDKYRNRLSSESTDLELYKVLAAMVAELEDGHAFIEIPKSLQNQIEEVDDIDDGMRRKVVEKINEKYVSNLKTYNKGIINWGSINDSLSYVQFNDFEDLANYGISNDLSGEEFAKQYWKQGDASRNYTKDALSGFEKQMAVVFEDIKDSKSCVLDVRFNGGGFDQVGLEILSYFTSERVFAFSKKARYNDGFTKTQDIYLDANKNQFNGKIYLLTSPQSASATETFVLASQNIYNVVRIGSSTEGILSDILSKTLPNGWEYGLSNEVYENADGINYEEVGIPADYDLNYSRKGKKFYGDLIQELEANDRAIEMAIDFNKESY